MMDLLSLARILIGHQRETIRWWAQRVHKNSTASLTGSRFARKYRRRIRAQPSCWRTTAYMLSGGRLWSRTRGVVTWNGLLCTTVHDTQIPMMLLQITQNLGVQKSICCHAILLGRAAHVSRG